MRFSETIQQMLHGPLHLRFVLQPLIAIALGLRDGRLDLQAGRRPYFWSLWTEREGRGRRLREGVRAVAIPFLIALVLDGVVQVLLWNRFRLWSALLVGFFLIALPYLAARGLGHRLLARWRVARRA